MFDELPIGEQIARIARRQIRILWQNRHTPTRIELSADNFRAVREWLTTEGFAECLASADDARMWGVPIRLVAGDHIVRVVSVEVGGYVRYDGHVPVVHITADPDTEHVHVEWER